MLRVEVGTYVGTGEENLLVALVELFVAHVRVAHEGVDRTVFVILVVEVVSIGLGLVDELFAGFHGSFPLGGVVGRVEDVLSLVVLVGGIVGVVVAVYQRAGGKEQHAGADGQSHNRGGVTVVTIFGIDGRQLLGYLLKFGIEPVDDIGVGSLADENILGRRIHVGKPGLQRYGTVGVYQQVIVVGDEETGLGLHVVDIFLIYLLLGQSLHVVDEDIGTADAHGEVAPEVTFPFALGSPVAQNLVDAVPVGKSTPVLRGREVVGIGVVVTHHGRIGVGYTVVNTGEPLLGTVFTVEYHFQGQNIVGRIVQVVGTRGNREEPDDSQCIFNNRKFHDFFISFSVLWV